MKYYHYTNFGATLQPPQANQTGFLAVRDNWESLPPDQWTAAEAYVAEAEERISQWRRGA